MRARCWFRWRRSGAALLVGLLAFGCTPADPLESIRKQQDVGDYAASLEPLRALLAERPKDPEANYRYGIALLATAQPSLATFPLNIAMDDPAWLVPAGIELAQAALVSEDYREAIRATTRVLEQHPDEIQALLWRAQAYAHARDNPQAAIDDANRVLELDPDMLEIYEAKILALIELGRHPEARELLAEAGRRLPADAPPHMLAWHCSTTAIFASEAGDEESALEKFRECREKYPTDPTVIENAVEFYDKRGEVDRSIETLRAALAASSGDRNVRVALAQHLRASGKVGEGEALLREATAVDEPRHAAVAWADLARFRHAMGEHGAAAEAWERAVEQVRRQGDPDPQLLFQYADALLVSGQLERALKIADEIDVPAQQHLIRGRVAQERGQPARALEEFDAAMRVWPDNPFARYYAALAAERLGDFDRALEEYRYAIRIRIGATDARTRAARLLIAEGQPLQAYQLLFLEVAKDPLEPAGELLGMFLMGRVANPAQLQSSLVSLLQRDPSRYPLAIATGAEGAAARFGPKAGLKLLHGAPGLRYSEPGSAPALRMLVRLAHAAGQPQLARREIDAGLAAHPEAAVFHEALGLQLEVAGDLPRARAAYSKAVELDPRNAGALAGMGRLAAAEDPAQALAYFDRAVAADPAAKDAALGAARALRALGRADEAAERLDALLVREPLEAPAAAELVSLDLERGAVTQKTLERARRAARFDASPQAFDQLGLVYARLSQPEEAAKASERARLLRERQASKGSPEGSDVGELPVEPPAAGG